MSLAANMVNRLRELSALTPGMPLTIALEIVENEFNVTPTVSPYMGDFDNAAALGQWAYNQPAVMQYLQSPEDQKKIHAIKELRALSYAGLKEAKEAIEYLCTHILGWTGYYKGTMYNVGTNF